MLWTLLLAGLVLTVALPSQAAAQVRELPDPGRTPGVIASTDEADVCGVVDGLTYSARHRKTSERMKSQVRALYNATSCGEIDHRLELSLGGADDVRNLWCQPGPEEAVWNYKLKDRLETYLWRTVCKRHEMVITEAQAVFLAPDWRPAYCEFIGGPPCDGFPQP
jgi:hypothetical protein